MADFDFNNIFGNNADISNILFDENQLSIIRDQFQREIINPLFQKYKNLSDKIENKITENTNNKSFIEKSSDPIGIESYKKSKNIDKKLDDITNPFLSKLENYYSELGKNLDNFSNFKFLPNIDFTNLNEKIQKKISDIENKLNFDVDTDITENVSKKRKPSKLKSRSVPNELIDINQDLTNKLEPLQNNNQNFTAKDFSDEFTNNITILIEETASNRTLLEKINDSMFSVKTFTSSFFPMLDKVLLDILPDISKNGLNSNAMGVEQKKIGEETPEISLSEKTINQFKSIFSNLFSSEMFKDLFDISKLNDLKDALNPISDENKMSWLDSLLKFGGLILAGGALMSLLGPVWDGFVKPWLEEKLGIKIKTFDELLNGFEKLYEGIQKWTILGGLKIVGETFSGMGTLLTKFGTLLEKGVTMFDDLLIKIVSIGSKEAASIGAKVASKGATSAASAAGLAGEKLAIEGAEEVAESGVKTLAKEAGVLEKMGLGKLLSFLPTLKGTIFKGIGKTTLKAIPVIGSLFSFGLAYDDFTSGDWMSGILNIGSGLASIVPGVGTAIAIGLDALNIFTDMTAEGSTKEERIANKNASLVNFGDKVINVFKQIPLLEWFVSLGEGIDALINRGDYGTAFQKLERVPGLGLVSGFVKGLYDSTNVKAADGTVKKFDVEGFQKTMKRNFGKQFLSMAPSAFGFRNKVAEWLGMEEYLESNDTFDENQVLPDEIENRRKKAIADANASKEKYEREYGENNNKEDNTKKFKEEEEKLLKELEQYEIIHGQDKRQLEDHIKKGKGWNPVYWDDFVEEKKSMESLVQDGETRVQASKIKLEQLRNFKPPQEQKADDFFESPNNLFSDISNIAEGKYYYNPQNNTKTYLNQDDDVYAMKRGGVIEESINKQLGEFTSVLLAGLRELKDNSSAGSFLNNPINNINVSNVSSNDSNNSYTSGKRDPIFDLRMEWWKSSSLERTS
jgi:hypothetical protein